MRPRRETVQIAQTPRPPNTRRTRCKPTCWKPSRLPTPARFSFAKALPMGIPDKGGSPQAGDPQFEPGRGDLFLSKRAEGLRARLRPPGSFSLVFALFCSSSLFFALFVLFRSSSLFFAPARFFFSPKLTDLCHGPSHTVGYEGVFGR